MLQLLKEVNQNSFIKTYIFTTIAMGNNNLYQNKIHCRNKTFSFVFRLPSSKAEEGLLNFLMALIMLYCISFCNTDFSNALLQLACTLHTPPRYIRCTCNTGQIRGGCVG